jgi:hypothetical protein
VTPCFAGPFPLWFGIDGVLQEICGHVRDADSLPLSTPKGVLGAVASAVASTDPLAVLSRCGSVTRTRLGCSHGLRPC